MSDRDGSRESGNLPAVVDLAGAEPEVIDGQVVGELAPRTAVVVLRPVVQVVQVVRVVVQHKSTRTAGRHVSYIPLGAMIVCKRLWESRSTARYERMIRAAAGAARP